MATHKNLMREGPFEDAAHLELAKSYLKMGQWEDALAQCRILVQHYKSLGLKNKAAKVMALMARIDPSKAGPKEEITGLNPLMKLKAREAANNRSEEVAIRETTIDEKGKEAYFDLAAELEIVTPEETIDHKGMETSEQPPECGEILKKLTPISSTRSKDPNFNYNLGVECVEAGRIDEAIEQFQIAYEKKQNVFESSHLLGLCFKKKSLWEEAHQAFEKALRVDGISREKILAAKLELGLIFKEQGKMEEALDLLGEVFISRPGISQYQRSSEKAPQKFNEGGKTAAQFCCSTDFNPKSQVNRGFNPSKNNQKSGKDRREYYCFYLLASFLLWLLQNQFCLNN